MPFHDLKPNQNGHDMRSAGDVQNFHHLQGKSPEIANLNVMSIDNHPTE